MLSPQALTFLCPVVFYVIYLQGTLVVKATPGTLSAIVIEYQLSKLKSVASHVKSMLFVFIHAVHTEFESVLPLRQRGVLTTTLMDLGASEQNRTAD